MAEWYSRADRERMAQGLPPLEHSTLTVDDYRDLVEFALSEAVEESPAKELVGSAKMGDMGGVHAGLTQQETDAQGKPTGKYALTIDWSGKMQAQAADPKNGPAYVTHRIMSAFHEVRHVEQKALMSGVMPIENRTDMEVATQMTVNALYPTAYKRGYCNTVTEIDADVNGAEGALAFFDRHPEIKERYGFDMRKQMMRLDEYDVLEDKYQLTKATPEELIAGMKSYRDSAYDDPWKKDGTEKTPDLNKMNGLERKLMERLESESGVTWADLEAMNNDERNVLLIQNAMDAIDDPDKKLGYNMKSYREGPVMTGRLDEVLRDENALRDLVQTPEVPAAAPAAPAWQQGTAFPAASAGTPWKTAAPVQEAPVKPASTDRWKSAAARFQFAVPSKDDAELAMG